MVFSEGRNAETLPILPDSRMGSGKGEGWKAKERQEVTRGRAPERVETMAKTKDKIAEIRRAVADYMQSEGCSCCRNMEAHDKNKAFLGKLLRVPKYEDGSGYDFSKFRTEAREDEVKDGNTHNTGSIPRMGLQIG